MSTTIPIDTLATLARSAFSVAISAHLDDACAMRSAAGAVLGAVGADGPVVEAAKRGELAYAEASFRPGVGASDADRWAGFVRGVLDH